MTSSTRSIGDDCDTILLNLHELVRQFWQAKTLADCRRARGRIADALDELHQRCPGEWTKPNFDVLVEDVKQEYEVGPYLKSLRGYAKGRDLDFQELTR